MNKKKTIKYFGFTLIELMVVIAIIAIIASVAVPSYNTHVIKVNRNEAMTTLLSFSSSLERYYTIGSSYSNSTTDGGVSPGAPKPNIFPDESPINSDDPLYNLTISQLTETSYTLRATPIPSKINKDDGILELTSAGIRRWDKDNSGSFDSSENEWTH